MTKMVSLVLNLIYLGLWIVIVITGYFVDVFTIPDMFYIVSFVLCFMVILNTGKDKEESVTYDDLMKVE